MKSSKIPRQLLALLLAFVIVFTNFLMPVQSFAEAATPEEALSEYLSGKIISSGGDGVVRSSDGLTYDIGLKTPSGSSITSIRFKNAASPYVTAWKVNDEAISEGYLFHNEHTNPSVPVKKRPSASENAYAAKVTVMLFEAGTAKSDINADKADPLISQDITLNILPEDPVYSVTFTPVDSKTQDPVQGAKITVEENWSTVYPEGNIYKMPKDAVYNIKVTADGYKNYINSSFTATSDGEVKLPMEKILSRNINFSFKDSNGQTINDAEVTVKKGYSVVQPEKDGSYNMIQGEEYSYTVTAKGFKDITGKITPSESTSETLEVIMSPVVLHKITFNITDKKGNPVADAKLTVKKDYDEVSPEKDGTYLLEEGVTYSYSVSGKNYTSIYSAEFTVTKAETINVSLEKNIKDYNVTINVIDNKGKPVPSPEISVTYEEEDYWDTVIETVKPVSGSTYILNKYNEYTIKVSAGKEYTSYTDYAYTPSGDEENIKLDIVLNKMSPEQELLDKVKKQYDAEFGPLRPDFKTEKNVKDTVLNHIKEYKDLEDKNVKAELVSTDDKEYIAEDGTINYKKDSEPNKNIHNIECTFKLVLGDAEVTTSPRVVQVGWDHDHVNKMIKNDADSLTTEMILGTNKDKNAITENLSLRRCMGSSMQDVWSVIEWDTSDPSVISLEKPSIDSPIYPLTGKIHPQSQDKEVTLTATFKINDTILNTTYEKITDFVSIPVQFKVTVKGTAEPAPTEAELKAILDKYYTDDLIVDAVTDKPVDFNAVTGSFLLPRYTKIKDENNSLVFNNKEITVTSDNEKLVTITGYRANVDPFGPVNEEVNLIVRFARDGVTAEKIIPLNIIPVSSEDLDKEIAMMEIAKENYFAGINDNQNPDKDNVTKDLHSFMEMQLDNSGNPLWIYASSETTGDGIITDNYFEDPWEMESAGYNKFKSSHPLVIKHDNLLVTRPEVTTEVTISSLLSSAKYGKYAPLHPENEKLQKLYKQEAFVTVTVTGTKEAGLALEDKVKEAKQFAESMKTGTGSGEYTEKVKEELISAINSAEKVLKDKDATEQAVNAEIQKLTNALETAKASKNPMEFMVCMTGFKDKNMPGMSYESVVKHDAASKAGYSKSEALKKEVTVLDAMVVLHQNMFGNDFNKDPEAYLKVASSGMITKLFGVSTSDLAFSVNGVTPDTMASNTVLKENDRLVVALLNSPVYKDQYLEFAEKNLSVKQGEDFTVTLTGHPFMTSEKEKTFKPQEGYTVKLQSLADSNLSYTAVTDTMGVAHFNAAKPGNYEITVTAGADYFIASSLNVEVKAVSADYSRVNDALDKVSSLDRDLYKDLTSLDRAVNAVKEGLDMSMQSTVDKYAEDILKEIAALKELDRISADENGNMAVKTDGTEVIISAQNIKAGQGDLEITFGENTKVIYSSSALDAVKESITANDKKITVSIKEITASDSAMNSAQQAAVKTNKGKLFEVSLLLTDSSNAVREISDFASGTSVISVPYEKDNSVNLKVYRIEADGSLTEMPSSYADGILSWTTGSHSFYMVSETAVNADAEHGETSEPENSNDISAKEPSSHTEKTSSEKAGLPATGDTNNMTMWIVIVLVALAAVIAIVVIKKKNRK